jgi:hypothetical protein
MGQGAVTGVAVGQAGGHHREPEGDQPPAHRVPRLAAGQHRAGGRGAERGEQVRHPLAVSWTRLARQA